MKVYHSSLQKNSKPKSKLIIFSVLIIFLGLVFGAGYLVYASDFFKIKNIEVSGVKNYSSENLTTDLKDFFKNRSVISSFLGPENILVWTADIGAFLSNKPEFKNLIVQKDIYRRYIKIDAQERQKYGIWCTIRTVPELTPTNADNERINEDQKQTNINDDQINSGDNSGESTTRLEENCFWFDNEGIIFVEAAAVKGELFNKVMDLTGRDLKPWDKVLDSRLLENLVKIFSILNNIDLNSKTLQLKDLKTEEVSLNPAFSQTVLFSLRFDPNFSLAAIKTLKKDGRWEKLKYVDFRVENRVYYKFK